MSKLVGLLACVGVAGCITTAASDNMSIGTYVVRYDLDHGYSLDRGSKWIVPDIAVSERPKFDAFFADEKLAKLVGKRVYCRCEIIEALDEARPRVVKAYLFAR